MMNYFSEQKLNEFSITHRVVSVLIFLLLLSPVASEAQVSQPNTIYAHKIDAPIKLDGILNEACWSEARRISNFQQHELDNGAPASERTEVAVVYTPDKLFIGVWCYDSEPDKLTAKQMKHDFMYWLDDNFEIIFDTYSDKRNGYVFVINPNGAKSDVLVTDGGKGFNRDWNTVWDAEVMVSDSGWFAEIEIPFSSLKYPDTKIQNWGINFERNIRRKQESVFWQGWSRDYEFEHVSHAGTLAGLENLQGDETLEFKPYISGGISYSSEKGSDKSIKAGGDINYLVTPTLKMNMTFFTDFAQVESDRAQINFSRFNLYYPEKRQFFLEGQNRFKFDIGGANIFYSRKIGYSDSGQTPIIGGVRLSGTAGNTNIGVLSMQTEGINGMPTANHSVVRLRHNVLKQSNVGVIITAENRTGHYNYVGGVDATYITSEFLGDKRLYIGGMIAQSTTYDKDDTDQNESGGENAYKVFVEYPNELYYFRAGVETVQENFNPEIGFLPRKNYNHGYFKFEWRPRPDSLLGIKRFDIKFLQADIYYNDKTGEYESMRLEFSPFDFRLNSGDNFWFDITYQEDNPPYAIQILRHNIVPGEYQYMTYDIGFSTFKGRKISGHIFLSAGQLYDADRLAASASLNMSINKHLLLSADYSRNFLSFENTDVVTDDIGGRIEYAFNPKTNFSFFGQWNSYHERILMNWRFHWIPVIGSDFYLVLNQTVGADGVIKLENTMLMSKFVWRFAM
ncbi:MAG: carbohydrate binding family 9 domain-containing protein [Chlorobi bacterium]|nr:carbohydrate binding family 9 domain-containing protein [Chlorobiota bacterium]